MSSPESAMELLKLVEQERDCLRAQRDTLRMVGNSLAEASERAEQSGNQTDIDLFYQALTDWWHQALREPNR